MEPMGLSEDHIVFSVVRRINTQEFKSKAKVDTRVEQRAENIVGKSRVMEDTVGGCASSFKENNI